jgi:hypothetical protein
MKTTATPNCLAFAILVLTFIPFLQVASAVSPPPDGGYPGFNTAEGQSALLGLTTGVGNAAVGWFALSSNTDGSYNTGVGVGALLFNVGNQSTGDGLGNTAIGAVALFNNITGAGNTATGVNALFSNNVGSTNTATGYAALGFNTAGNNNTAVGISALINNTTGSNNTALGAFAGNNVATASNVICIGADGNDVDDSCFIGNIFGSTSSGGLGVFVNDNGRLGTTTSSRRFKEDIEPMGKVSEAVLALKPVAFRYKKEIDPQGIPQFGLVAEDVAAVNPDLVVRDKEGKPYSVRYDQVNAMLLNEFLKEHRKVEEQIRVNEKQQATIAELKSQLKAVTRTLKKQAAQIQRVSAQVRVKSAAPQLVANEP